MLVRTAWAHLLDVVGERLLLLLLLDALHGDYVPALGPIDSGIG